MKFAKAILALSCSLFSMMSIGQLRFANEWQSLQKAIEEKFLIADQSYYREHAEKQKDERPVSFSLAALRTDPGCQ